MSKPKNKFSLAMDADLLTQVDEVAEARDESRSAVIERIVRNGIKDEKAFLRQMENPLTRKAFELLTSNPGVVRKLATLVGEELDDETIERVTTNPKKQPERGRQRRVAKSKGQNKAS